MITTYRAFRPPRSVREYGYDGSEPLDQVGSPSGFRLPWDAIMDQSDARTERRSPMYVVLGEYAREDGYRWPELGVTTAHIEANSDHRVHPNGGLRLRCSDLAKCGLWDGKHAKSCER